MIGTPERLVAYLKDFLQVKTDCALADQLGVDHSHFTSIKKGRAKISSTLLLKMYDLSNASIEELRAMGGLA